MFLSLVYRIGEGLRKCPFGHFLYRKQQKNVPSHFEAAVQNGTLTKKPPIREAVGV